MISDQGKWWRNLLNPVWNWKTKVVANGTNKDATKRENSDAVNQRKMANNATNKLEWKLKEAAIKNPTEDIGVGEEKIMDLLTDLTARETVLKRLRKER